MKVYPDHTLENALRDSGAEVRCLWELPGPTGSAVAWLEGLSVNGHVVIVQTYAERGEVAGWEAYIPASESNLIAETIAAVKTRCSA